MANKVHFTVKDILDQRFHASIHGYSPKEVDSYLDMIIADYRTYNTVIKAQNKKISDLLNQKEDAVKPFQDQAQNLQKKVSELMTEVHQLKHTQTSKYVNSILKSASHHNSKQKKTAQPKEKETHQPAIVLIKKPKKTQHVIHAHVTPVLDSQSSNEQTRDAVQKPVAQNKKDLVTPEAIKGVLRRLDRLEKAVDDHPHQSFA